VQTAAQIVDVGDSLVRNSHVCIVDDVAGDRTAAARLAAAAGMRIAPFDGGQTFLDALPKPDD